MDLIFRSSFSPEPTKCSDIIWPGTRPEVFLALRFPRTAFSSASRASASTGRLHLQGLHLQDGLPLPFRRKSGNQSAGSPEGPAPRRFPSRSDGSRVRRRHLEIPDGHHPAPRPDLHPFPGGIFSAKRRRHVRPVFLPALTVPALFPVEQPVSPRLRAEFTGAAAAQLGGPDPMTSLLSAASPSQSVFA